MSDCINAEKQRLQENYYKEKNWLKWGPYLSERQWGTVREDYSANGDAWNYLTHDMARSKAYRWGEDGIAGISDERQRICFAIALWNGQDAILKERLFGLTPSQANHGEDVKELYYYLDNTPSHSYMKYLYKYPQSAFPYEKLEHVNKSRTKYEDEYEIADTGVFDHDRYFDVFTEYAKADAEDICIRISVHNRSNQQAPITILPTLWCRNLWSFGLTRQKPLIETLSENGSFAAVKLDDKQTGTYYFYFQTAENVLFTENETNTERLYQYPNNSPFVKDSFHNAIISNNLSLFDQKTSGTKCAPFYRLLVAAKDCVVIQLRLCGQEAPNPLGDEFEKVFEERIREADEFYESLIPTTNPDLKNIQRQAYAGMLWSKQFYYIDIPSWLDGDPGQPAPPEQRKNGRNSNWPTLNNEDIISIPDKWEYPWYAAWDLPFHCITLAHLDLEFAKNQLLLLLREWYMNPYGQIPAYEWNFSDVNPPVQAWACLQIYKLEKEKTGVGDTVFLERVFQKLLINFTWWVNRKDRLDNNVFEGGFLGLDNIGVFDRSNIPGNGILEQADGTAWMGMYCLDMLEMALELAQTNKAFEDMATKFFEHFTYIAASLNQIKKGYKGAWDEEDGFFYDVLRLPTNELIPIKVRSLVGLTSLFAVHIIDKELLDKLPEFYGRMKWFINYRQKNNEYPVVEQVEGKDKVLLSLIPHERLEKILNALLNEREFLSDGGIRSLSKIHEEPYTVFIEGQEFGLNYQPGDSNSSLFGGNSNWRGPVWMPMNFLIISALEKYYQYYLQDCMPELPSGSGNKVNLKIVAQDLRNRLISLFTKDSNGKRKINGNKELFDYDPHFKDLILFFEHFHGDDGRGIGASHQTGWTGLIAEIIRKKAEVRSV